MTKKDSTNKSAKHRQKPGKPSPADGARTITQLRRELAESLEREKATAKKSQECSRDLTEALEHQTATAEMLGIVSRSPTDVQPVLDAIVESAAKVCGIDDVVLRLIEGDSLVMRAHIGSLPLGRA